LSQLAGIGGGVPLAGIGNNNLSGIPLEFNPLKVRGIHRTPDKRVCLPASFHRTKSKAGMDAPKRTPVVKILYVGVNLVKSALPTSET